MRTQELTIEAGRAEAQYWRDVWQYRGLIYFLAWRDILVRYKQTVIGVAWALLRPLLTMGVFTVLFGRLAKLPSQGVPYPILVFAALLPWQLFAGALIDISFSLVKNASLVTKVYFPRVIYLLGAAALSITDFLLSGLILVALMVWYGYSPGWSMLTLPLFIAVALSLAMGAGLWLSALTVRYRDFQTIVPYLVQFGLYVSPVGFSSAVVPAAWRFIYSLNPMVGVIDGFRWAILGSESAIYWPGFLLSLVVITGLLVSGIWYFRRTERTFADVI
jgi:lipopolysaccharide transport system permease protein